MSTKRAKFRFLTTSILILALSMIGLWQMHLQVIFSQDGLAVGNIGDTRLINLTLEHTYRFLFSDWPHTFWKAPWIYFPHKYSLAYSDNYAGNIPFYAPWRMIGWDPIDSFQVWMTLCAWLNFICAYALLRKLNCSCLGSIAGAYIFAFCLGRLYHLSAAQQTVPQFLMIISLIGLCIYFSESSLRLRLTGIFVFALFWVWQLLASIYLAWFYSLALLICFIFAVCHRSLRTIIFKRAINDWKIWTIILICVTLLMIPTMKPYFEVFAEQGKRPWESIRINTPTIGAYFRAYSGSLFYSFFDDVTVGKYFGRIGGGHYFSGFTVIICFISSILLLLRSLKQLSFQYLTTVSLYLSLGVFSVLLILSMEWRHDVTLWKIIYYLVPGAGAFRVVGRVFSIMLVPLAICIGILVTFLQSRSSRFGNLAACLICFLLIAENSFTQQGTFEKAIHENRVKAIKQKLQSQEFRNCDIFYYRKAGSAFTEPYAVTHIDAMWASMELSKPTLNGYSEGYPPAWEILSVPTDITRDRIDFWLRHNNIDPNSTNVCIIEN